MKVITVNKKARFNYNISETYEAGIVLVGSEVKSIRNGGVSINESFVLIKNDEAFLKNAYIKPYENGSSFNPESRRTRKLLLKKSEITKIKRKIEAEGLALVPIRIYLKGNYVKIEIGIGKGKKLYDKRETIKQKTIKRNLEREDYYNN
ncbi:MAG: SsrA-binding protein SmpB [Clostridia bacterium]|nr:SsrA-binding protein SmpB [Clostridia bacterium]